MLLYSGGAVSVCRLHRARFVSMIPRLLDASFFLLLAADIAGELHNVVGENGRADELRRRGRLLYLCLGLLVLVPICILRVKHWRNEE